MVLDSGSRTGMSTTSALLGPFRWRNATHDRLNCMDAPPAQQVSLHLSCAIGGIERPWLGRCRISPLHPPNQTSGTCSLSINTSRVHMPDPSESILAGIGQLRSSETDPRLSLTAPGTFLATSKRGGGKVVCRSSLFLPDCSHPNPLSKSFIHSTLMSYPSNCPRYSLKPLPTATLLDDDLLHECPSPVCRQ
jgi:hypothetical protein